jgi:ATPase subunit of ABC transporter with duplicated ATPase domains
MVRALTFHSLAQVLPTEYGVPKRWHYIFTDPYKKWKNRGRKQASFLDAPAVLEAGMLREIDLAEIQHEDEDVKAERERVMGDRYPADSPLVMKRMRKMYGSDKLAVKDVTFAVEKDIIFGLLGPNGAGELVLR